MVFTHLSITVAEDQYNEIISSPDAWQVTDDGEEGISDADLDVKPTNSARRVKALIEQITGGWISLLIRTAN